MNAASAFSLPIQVIPGTELSVAYKKQDIHIVGLFVDHRNKSFQDMTQLLIRRRLERNEEMIRRFNANGIPVTYEELTMGNPDAVITRAHFARYLVEHQIVKIPNEAFKKYLDPGCPYFIPREYIQPEDGIEIIRKAGGVPILAHPLHYKLPQKELETLIARLKDAGLMGIEVKYSNHTVQDEYYASQLASRFDLLPSGGSTFTEPTNRRSISVPAAARWPFLTNIWKISLQPWTTLYPDIRVHFFLTNNALKQIKKYFLIIKTSEENFFRRFMIISAIKFHYLFSFPCLSISTMFSFFIGIRQFLLLPNSTITTSVHDIDHNTKKSAGSKNTVSHLQCSKNV